MLILGDSTNATTFSSLPLVAFRVSQTGSFSPGSRAQLRSPSSSACDAAAPPSSPPASPSSPPDRSAARPRRRRRPPAASAAPSPTAAQPSSAPCAALSTAMRPPRCGSLVSVCRSISVTASLPARATTRTQALPGALADRPSGGGAGGGGATRGSSHHEDVGNERLLGRRARDTGAAGASAGGGGDGDGDT